MVRQHSGKVPSGEEPCARSSRALSAIIQKELAAEGINVPRSFVEAILKSIDENKEALDFLAKV